MYPLNLIFILLYYFLCTFGLSFAQNNLQKTNQQWLEDLQFATKIMIKKHPDLYYRISEANFNLTVKRAEQKIRQAQTDEECMVALRQVIAAIQDGHTMLGMNNLPGYRKIFPVRCYEFSDGIYITGITTEYASYIGAKIIKIGRYTAEEAFDLAATLAFADNDFYQKEQAPLILVTCKFAFGLGITQDIHRLSLVVKGESGRDEQIVLTAVTPPGGNNLLRGMDIGPEGVSFSSAFTNSVKRLPLYLRHLNGIHNYWFEHDREHRTIYMQLNLIIDQQDERFDAFYKRMFKYIDETSGRIDKFILDLRFNNGGNGPLVLPFINELIKRDNINRPGHLYTLIGRRSFSAAVLLVAEMMLHTHTLLVGEPTGAAQNMFSDYVYQGTLPNSGAALLVSTEYFNIAWPANRNYTIPPHYPAPFTAAEFFAGEDPALEAIFADRVKALETVLYKEGPQAALNYFNEIKYDWGAHSDELCITPSTFPISSKYKGEAEYNDLGFSFLKQKKLPEAQSVFELNIKLYPGSFNAWDSYAEYFMTIGDNHKAKKYYNKSLELNPDNQNAIHMVEKLQKE